MAHGPAAAHGSSPRRPLPAGLEAGAMLAVRCGIIPARPSGLPPAAPQLSKVTAMLFRIAFAATLLAFLSPARAADPLPAVDLYLPSPCLACIDWAEHLMDAGFKVHFKETADMATVKRRLKVPKDAESVHTAVVAGYFVEGHVPADDIKTLLKEKPKARGIAVPGLPRGAPGYVGATSSSSSICESGCAVLDRPDGSREPRRELYETLLVGPDGRTSIFARH
jgi:hypothetical protein